MTLRGFNDSATVIRVVSGGQCQPPGTFRVILVKMTGLPSMRAPLIGATVGICTLFSVSACKDGLMAGVCGMEGQRIECIYDLHCPDWGTQVCSLHGECIDDPLIRCQGLPTGERCVGPPVDRVCSFDKRCLPPCNTHADCDGITCWCLLPEDFGPSTFSAGYCRESRCGISGTCLSGYEPVQGSLECEPIVLEGDCHGSDGCPPGYDQTSARGCTMVEPFAWREPDAGLN